jgi:hypothetical protein
LKVDVSVEPSRWVELLADIEGSAPKKPLSTTIEIREQIQLNLEVIRVGIEREKLNLAKDNRGLRKTIAKCVGAALAFEILMLFVLVVSQGLGHVPWWHSSFKLEQWTFNVFTSAVLLQTFGLATLIVKNIFPPTEEETGRKRGKK